VQIFLTTFSFQAPAFYKRGFEVVTVVDDHPRGHQNLRLRKRLSVIGAIGALDVRAVLP